MDTTKTYSQIQALEPASDTLRSAQPKQIDSTPRSRSAPRKALAVINGLMDLMVDGLAPGVRRKQRSYELIVVGAGSAGTAAAIWAASEGIDTLIFEAGRAGGGAQFIECIDNCAANPRGITLGSGAEMTGDQGRHFLLDLQPGLAVTGIHADAGYLQVETNQGHRIDAKSLILAPGLQRRRLNVPGEETLAGAGVHVCADCEGLNFTGKNLVVIGASDSGIEQALFLATLAERVTVVEKRARLRCSPELYRRAKAHPKITFRLNSIVREFKGRRVLNSVLIEDAKTGEMEELYPDAAFIATGFEPATSAFRDSVDVDQKGFIQTNRSMQTKLPGVFAAGHARSRRVRNPEDAANDGNRAALMVRKYLAKSKR